MNITIQSLHTSGHATIPVLQGVVDMLQPQRLIPIHTGQPADYGRFGVEVESAKDGVPIAL